jgi:hypothetical protein
MSTLEQKEALLRKRWFELHPTKPAAVEKEKLVRVPVGPGPVQYMNWSDKKILVPPIFTKEMFDSLKLTVKGETPDLIKQLEDSIALVKLRKFVQSHPYERGMTNNNRYLECLKNVEWVANIAVGIDKRFDTMEWWSVCPPVGVMISYVGATAKERAIAKAHELKEYY